MPLGKSKYVNLIRLLRNERHSLDELIHMQNTALRKLIKHAYSTVEFYKELFDDNGLVPDEIQSTEDLYKIPIIDKKLLLKNSYNRLISKVYDINNLKPIRTAGSNGTPFLFYIDDMFDQYRKAQYLRPYITNGRRFWDNSVLFSIRNAPPKKWFQYLSLIPNIYIFPGSTIEEQIQILQKKKPDTIQGYASSLNLISTKIVEENINIPKPRLIFTDSELLVPDIRKNIERAFQTKVIDIYGTYETDNIGYECHHHKGYHLAMDSVIMEFIREGKTAKANEEGEIVVTVLNNFAMPFIRYNLHDIGSFSELTCPCGRTFPLMKQIKGRDNDYLITEDGRKLPIFNIANFDMLAPNVREYQIVQESINSFEVYIVPGKTYKNHGGDIIVPTLKNFSPNAKINVNIVKEIDREPSGKFKAFKSKVNT